MTRHLLAGDDPSTRHRLSGEIDGCVAEGYPRVEDFDGPDPAGVGADPVNVVDRVLFEQGRAVADAEEHLGGGDPAADHAVRLQEFDLEGEAPLASLFERRRRREWGGVAIERWQADIGVRRTPASVGSTRATFAAVATSSDPPISPARIRSYDARVAW